MIRRDRHGWRVLIVLSRLAVAGVLTFARPFGLTGSASVLAQTVTAEKAHPPPPPPVLPSGPPAKTLSAKVESPVTHPGRDPDQPARHTDTAQPTPAAHFTPPFDAPPQIVLPIPPSLEQLTAERNSLNQLLHRDRRHQLLLTRGDRALSGGNIHDAILNLQALIEATDDAFYWPDDSLAPCGARLSAYTRLRSLAPELRDTYQQLHGDEARAILREGIENKDPQRLFEVLRRYRLTDAGRESMIRELLFAYDCGHLTRAARLGQMLAEDPYHWRQLPSQLQALVNRLNKQALRTHCHVHAVPAPSCQTTSPPALRPLWTRSLSEGLASSAQADSVQTGVSLGRFVDEAIHRWLVEHDDRRLPVATANQATVVGDLLLIRDFAGVRTLDLHTGRPVWNYPCAGSLAQAAWKSQQQEARGGGAPPLNFHANFAGHGTRGRLTTDGRRLFLIDDHESSASRASSAADDDGSQSTNRLVALSLGSSRSSGDLSQGSLPQTAWVRGSRSRDESDPLEGHFFLGPPLPLDGRLFVLTEYDRRLQCVALSAADGELLWQQPIAIVEQPIDWDSSRLQMACTPLHAGPVIACPTEVGVVVGVDSLSGALRWVYDHVDDDQRLAAGRWSSSARRNHGRTEFPSRMLFDKGRIVHLPFRSGYVHCVDAETGACIWKADRRGALAVSAVASDMVILIGPREVIALSSTDGSLEWKTTCPEPAGHGLVSGGRYLLPIRDGRCLGVSLRDGTLTGLRFGKLLSELSQPPVESISARAEKIHLAGHEAVEQPHASAVVTAGGNLLAMSDVIIVSAPASVAVFPQARPLLQTATKDHDHRTATPRQRLEAAILHLLLGEQAQARHWLQALCDGPASTPVHRAATRLLREILFTELAGTTDPQPILDQLATMTSGDSEHVRFLVSRIDAELKLGSSERLIEAIDLFRSTPISAHVTPCGEAELVVQASAYVADQLAIARISGAGKVRSALDAYVARAAADVSASGDLADRERLVALFDEWPHVAELRNDVAVASLAAGHLQQAELLLLKGRDSEDREAAGRARRLLTDVYAAQRLLREAAGNLAELTMDFREDSVGNGLTGREFVEQFSHDDPVWQIVRRRRVTPPPAYRVRITEHICDEECETLGGCQANIALRQHERIRRKFLIGDDSTFALIDRGIVPGDRNSSRLSLISRETGRLHAEFELPAAYWQLAATHPRRCGQLLPICGHSAYGLSLLQQQPIWSSCETDDKHARDKVKLGPVGTDFCVLQTTRRLFVIHPGTGAMLWERRNLPPDVGLLSNESTGVIGDAKTLVLFDEDQRSYTVYRMRSGRRERRGRLDLSDTDTRRHRHAVGAKLVYIATKGPQDVLCIWDAATDRVLFEQPIRERLYCPVGSGEQYALISNDGRLLIADVRTGRIALELPLAEKRLENVTDLSVALDRDHYFVNLVGCSTDATAETVAATDEVELPSIRVQGQLMAVSRAGRVLWQQSVADAVMLTNSECCLPVLTLVSRVRDPLNRQTSRLRIDVLDARSGETLARRDDLRRTRIVQSNYSHRPGQLTLVGLNSQIDIDFGPRRDELLIHAEVDQSEASLVR